MERINTNEELGIISCPICGKPLVYRKSRYGVFIGCSGFPACKYIQKQLYTIQKNFHIGKWVIAILKPAPLIKRTFVSYLNEYDDPADFF